MVQFSGGIGSWSAARRVVAEHGTEDLILLFSDTLIEDQDLYRFLDEAAEAVPGFKSRKFAGQFLHDIDPPNYSTRAVSDGRRCNCPPRTGGGGCDFEDAVRFELSAHPGGIRPEWITFVDRKTGGPVMPGNTDLLHQVFPLVRRICGHS